MQIWRRRGAASGRAGGRAARGLGREDGPVLGQEVLREPRAEGHAVGRVLQTAVSHSTLDRGVSIRVSFARIANGNQGARDRNESEHADVRRQLRQHFKAMETSAYLI